MDYIKNPMEIENTSMKIIESEMGEHNFTKEELLVIKRTIHTTAPHVHFFGNLEFIKELLK